MFPCITVFLGTQTAAAIVTCVWVCVAVAGVDVWTCQAEQLLLCLDRVNVNDSQQNQLVWSG